MIDREKVIAGLTMLVDRKNDDTCEGLKCCKIAKDAIALLKEQEPVKPTWSLGKPFCGACGLRIRSGKYCSECGKPILWESR